MNDAQIREIEKRVEESRGAPFSFERGDDIGYFRDAVGQLLADHAKHRRLVAAGSGGDGMIQAHDERIAEIRKNLGLLNVPKQIMAVRQLIAGSFLRDDLRRYGPSYILFLMDLADDRKDRLAKNRRALEAVAVVFEELDGCTINAAVGIAIELCKERIAACEQETSDV